MKIHLAQRNFKKVMKNVFAFNLDPVLFSRCQPKKIFFVYSCFLVFCHIGGYISLDLFYGVGQVKTVVTLHCRDCSDFFFS